MSPGCTLPSIAVATAVGLLGWAAPAVASCPVPVGQLEGAVDSAQLAFTRMDAGAFRAASDVAFAGVECLAEPVPRATAARLHRLRGLRAFVDGDDPGARAAFSAARAADPAYRFPAALLPTDHPARALFDEATLGLEHRSFVPRPTTGALQFDGAPAGSRPSTRATVMVVLDGQGRVARSAYLWPDDPLPPYASGGSTGTALPGCADIEVSVILDGLGGIEATLAVGEVLRRVETVWRALPGSCAEAAPRDMAALAASVGSALSRVG
jgi:hypothetical protein